MTEWNGGKVHKITDSIIHLMRGQVFVFEESDANNCKKVFTFGGASSHDRGPSTGTRDLDEGVCWWPEEVCIQDEVDEAVRNLGKHDNKVDYIVTHCLPMMKEMQLGYGSVDSTTNFLQNVEESVEFEKWFCGHYHKDCFVSPKIRIVYNDVLKVQETSL